MYAFIVNNTVEEYPASRASLQRRYPHTSFPKVLTDETYISFGYVKVQPTEQPSYNPEEGDLVQENPELINGTWVQKWSFVKYDDAIINQQIADKQNQLVINERTKRNQLLEQSDLDVILSLEAANSIPDALKTYRQALRDVPEQAGFPDNITWPTKP
jgi:hypothetical protein